MAEPEGKQVLIQFWAPNDVPAEFQGLVPNMENDGWVAYVPAELMEDELVKRLLSSGRVFMSSLPDGGALFAGPPDTHISMNAPQNETNSKM